MYHIRNEGNYVTADVILRKSSISGIIFNKQTFKIMVECKTKYARNWYD